MLRHPDLTLHLLQGMAMMTLTTKALHMLQQPLHTHVPRESIQLMREPALNAMPVAVVPSMLQQVDVPSVMLADVVSKMHLQVDVPSVMLADDVSKTHLQEGVPSVMLADVVSKMHLQEGVPSVMPADVVLSMVPVVLKRLPDACSVTPLDDAHSMVLQGAALALDATKEFITTI
eukprot:XP_011682166.1 PREDICTED: uncharacterized protein LOC105446708 [Strongylocentrotus purpuratus]